MRLQARILPLMALAAITALTLPSTAIGAPGDCRLIRGADTPEDSTDDVSVCRQDVWIHQAASKVGNLDAQQGAFPSWNTTPPSASVTGGAGGGYIATNQTDAPIRPTFQGTFTGQIDNIAATLYAFVPGRQTSTTMAMWFTLTVDGEVLYQSAAVERPALSPGGQAVLKTNFAFVNAYDALAALGLNGPDRVHTIRLQIQIGFTANDTSVFVYDTTEVPSGFIFNLETPDLAGYTQIDLTPPA